MNANHFNWNKWLKARSCIPVLSQLHQRGVIATVCIMFLLKVNLHANIKGMRKKDLLVSIKCIIIIEQKMIVYNNESVSIWKKLN